MRGRSRAYGPRCGSILEGKKSWLVEQKKYRLDPLVQDGLLSIGLTVE
jgi:hypothetical protein